MCSGLLAATSAADIGPAFTAPNLQGKAVMLVAPQAIETALVARRLERWGAQTCTLTDAAVAGALLPERPWHALIASHDLDPTELTHLGEAARFHATHRIIMVTPAARRWKPSGVRRTSRSW